jgi:hypothetical protein
MAALSMSLSLTFVVMNSDRKRASYGKSNSHYFLLSLYEEPRNAVKKKGKKRRKKDLVFRRQRETRDEKRTKYDVLGRMSICPSCCSSLSLFSSSFFFILFVQFIMIFFLLSLSLLYLMTKEGSEDDRGAQLNRLAEMVPTNYKNTFYLVKFSSK